MEVIIALIALLVSIVSCGLSFYFWRRQFRPIVTAAVKTNKAGNMAIAYDLVVRNSGSIPARNIRMTAENRTLAQALSDSAKNEDKSLWLACFDGNTTIPILHNDDTVSCSFGTTGEGNSGFWKYNSQISIMIEYEGWFGHKYKQPQELFVRDSGSFTVRMWG